MNRGRLTSLLEAVVGLALMPFVLLLLPALVLVAVVLVVLVVEHVGDLVTAAVVLGVTVNVGLVAALVVSVVRDRRPDRPARAVGRGQQVIAPAACRVGSAATKRFGRAMAASGRARPRRPRGTLATVAKGTVRLTPSSWDVAERAAAALQVTRDAYLDQLLANEAHRLDADDRPVWWTTPVSGDQPALPLELEEAPLKRTA